MTKLQKTRLQKGITQAKLAEAAGVNPRMVQQYEQGIRDINGAKLPTVLKLAAALNCPLSDIMDDPETLELLAQCPGL